MFRKFYQTFKAADDPNYVSPNFKFSLVFHKEIEVHVCEIYLVAEKFFEMSR